MRAHSEARGYVYLSFGGTPMLAEREQLPGLPELWARVQDAQRAFLAATLDWFVRTGMQTQEWADWQRADFDEVWLDEYSLYCR